MKLTIVSNFSFQVSSIQYSDSKELVLRLLSEQDLGGNRFSYEVDLGCGAASAKKVVMLSEYIQNYISRSTIKEKTRQSYFLMDKHLHSYGDCDIEEVTTEYLQGFISYLEGRGLKRGSVLLLFQKLASVLHSAYREGLFDDRVLQRVRRPRKSQTKKGFLTEKELAKLAKTELPIGTTDIRDMFLFSCLSGLRFSDIQNLRWSNIKSKNRHLVLEFSQQKTGTSESFPLCSGAEELLRKIRRGSGKVFRSVSNQLANKVIKRWCKMAGIKKDISFHTARHTFCVMLLSHDVPIFTVQKLMCHSDIRSTNVYADILNKTKSKAVKKLPVIDDIAMRKVG